MELFYHLNPLQCIRVPEKLALHAQALLASGMEPALVRAHFVREGAPLILAHAILKVAEELEEKPN